MVKKYIGKFGNDRYLFFYFFLYGIAEYQQQQ